MKPDILMLQPMAPVIGQPLEDLFTVHALYAAPDPEALLASVGPLIRAVVTGGARGIRNELMDRLPALELVAIHGVGTDAVDLRHARIRGIRVTNTPDIVTQDVADLAVGMMIALQRHMLAADAYVRRGDWENGAALSLTRRVSGRHVGLIGMGRIGQAIAHRLLAFGCTVSMHTRHPHPELPYRHVADPVELARSSNVLILAAAADAGRVIVTAEVLAALGTQGLFINVARGVLVDEQALIAALQSGTIAGAGLDVYAREPHVPDVLRTLPNVILQPHRGSATEETRCEMAARVIRNLVACFAGQPLPDQVALPD